MKNCFWGQQVTPMAIVRVDRWSLTHLTAQETPGLSLCPQRSGKPV